MAARIEAAFQRAGGDPGKCNGAAPREYGRRLESYAVLLREMGRKAEAKGLEARATATRAQSERL